MKIEAKQIDNIEFGWNGKPDYPEFCNAFIDSCDVDGLEATDTQVDWINDNLLGDLYDKIYESLI